MGIGNKKYTPALCPYLGSFPRRIGKDKRERVERIKTAVPASAGTAIGRPFYRATLDFRNVDHRQIFLVRLFQAHQEGGRRVQRGNAGRTRFHRVAAD